MNSLTDIPVERGDYYQDLICTEVSRWVNDMVRATYRKREWDCDPNVSVWSDPNVYLFWIWLEQESKWVGPLTEERVEKLRTFL